jgi:hypothetical protein
MKKDDVRSGSDADQILAPFEADRIARRRVFEDDQDLRAEQTTI